MVERTGIAVVAVVVTMNRPERLWRNVARIRAEGVHRVVVVNNGHPLPGPHPDGCLVLEPGENTGPAGGFALGLDRALAEGADLLWLFNDDDAPLPGSLSRLVSIMSGDPTIGALGPSARGSADFAGANYLTLTPPAKREDALYDVEASAFAGLLVRRQAATSTLPLDTSWFFYGEETEFGLKLRAAGWRFCGLGERLVESGAAGSSTGRTPEWRAYYQARNGWLLARRWGGAAHLRRHSWRMLKVSVAAFGGPGPLSLLRARCRGLLDGVLGRTGRRVDPPSDIGS